MLLLLKILLIWFLFTSCEQAEYIETDGASTAALSSKLVPSKWKSKNTFPLELKYGNSFSPTEIAAIENSTQNWSSSTNNEIDFFSTSASSYNELNSLDEYDDNEFGIYKLSNWPAELPGTALAVTQIYGNRYNIGKPSEYIEIDHADILINFEHFDFTTDYSWGYDLETVVLHELGHFLGLYHDHSSAEESIMYPTISRYNTARKPKEKDTTKILTKYSTPHNLGVSSHNLVAKTNNDQAQPVTLILELYPDGTEIMRIKKESGNEIIHNNHSHH